MTVKSRRPRFCEIAISILIVASGAMIQGAGKKTSDFVKEGEAAYAKGDYKNAVRLFEHVSAHVPDHTVALYHLGNSYLRLGRNTEAKSAYERSMASPGADEQTKAHCQTAITHLDKMLAASTAKSDLAATRKTAREEESMRRYEEQVAAIDKRRDEILNEAKQRVAKIHKDCAERIQNENATTNQRIKNSETGERKTGLTSAQEDAITEEYTHEADRIMYEANQRVKGIQYPPKPH